MINDDNVIKPSQCLLTAFLYFLQFAMGPVREGIQVDAKDAQEQFMGCAPYLVRLRKCLFGNSWSCPLSIC